MRSLLHRRMAATSGKWKRKQDKEGGGGSVGRIERVRERRYERWVGRMRLDRVIETGEYEVWRSCSLLSLFSFLVLSSSARCLCLLFGLSILKIIFPV